MKMYRELTSRKYYKYLSNTFVPSLYYGAKTTASFELRRESSSTSIADGNALWRTAGYIS